MAGRLALLSAVIALCASGWSVYRLGEFHALVRQWDARPAPAAAACCERRLEPARSSPGSPSDPTPAGASTARAQPVAAIPEMPGWRSGNSTVTDRGDEQVVNIGEAMDVDAIYIDAASQEVTELGGRLEP